MDVKKFLPYIITLMVGFGIAWILQEQQGGACDCSEIPKLKREIERLEDRLLRSQAMTREAWERIERVVTIQGLMLKTSDLVMKKLDKLELEQVRAREKKGLRYAEDYPVRTNRWKIDGEDEWREGPIVIPPSKGASRSYVITPGDTAWLNVAPVNCTIIHADGYCPYGTLDEKLKARGKN